MKNKQAEKLHPQTLKPELLPLTGRHLIEASAGTGKTFNISRIYLRLLLERKLDVKNILVMTFTRAATEELRARIAKEIRHALENWGQFDEGDAFFAALTRQFTLQQVYPALHNALLHLDEAAIFTIHGFCRRVLSQQAFSSGIDFNVQMEADTSDIELEAIRDWYRALAQEINHEDVNHQSDLKDKYELLVNSWPAPENFKQAFHEVLSSSTPLQVKKPQLIQEEFQQQKAICWQLMSDHRQLVFDHFIDPHKQKIARSEEWELLLQWLRTNYFSSESKTISQAMPKEASNVFNGARFSRKETALKQQFVDLFTPLKQLKEEAKKISDRLQKALSYQFAAQGIELVRAKIKQAKQRSRVMNYDDLIQQLSTSLSDNSTLAALIRKQYPVALVDEFQDTDPQQYTILEAVYQIDEPIEDNNEACALYMIGDPKQAIYAFRSGDVFTYLSARDNAQYQWLMDTNWRSSQQMISAYNRLFYGEPLVTDDKPAQNQKVFGFGIQYSPVKSAGRADKYALQGIAEPAALQLLYFPFNEDYASGRSKKEELNQDFCAVIAAWCSSEIHALLTKKTHLGEKRLLEQDIAVLVRDKKEAAYLQNALRQAGYASVYLSTHDNVFFSQEASELELVLQGILQLENEHALIAALATRYFSCDTEQLFSLQENEAQWERYRDQVSELRETWLKRGFMAMALKLLYQNFKPDPQQHQRSLTNAIQLLEILQHASQRQRQPEQLLNWLREQLTTDQGTSEAELRLESNANLIRIITQHGSKGLEYPVVFIPFSTRYKDPTKFGVKNIDLFKYHERNTRQLNYFIGQDKVISDLFREEAWAETVRLLYVAITRAEHRCYLCAAPFSNAHLSPLGQTLKMADDAGLYQHLESLAASSDDSIHLQQIDDLEFTVSHALSTIQKMTFSAAQFSGKIERNWWLSSFSALTRNLRHGGISTPDHDQEQVQNVLSSVAETVNKICFNLTKGAATGNLLHDILEHTDFSQPHWQRSIVRPLARFSESLDLQQQENLIAWLGSCLDVRLPDGPKLNELHWSHTLRETEFYFPMEQVKTASLSQLLTRHRYERIQMNDEYGRLSSVQLPGYQALQGIMHGFIDLIFQWQDRYYIVDYKSTHLGDQFENYMPDALEKNIRENYYDLQYLLYSLALHRYLKSRLADYDPLQHFGGIYYLYLRGMQLDSATGIFHTLISPDLLQELDDLFSSSDSNCLDDSRKETL